MGTISSGVGLISGLDIQGLVGQLMEIETRPRDQLSQRIEGITQKQTSFLGLQAQLLAVRLAAVNFGTQSVFEQKSAASSNEDVLGVTTTRFSQPGTYSFRVKRLASTHQLISNGFSSRSSNIGSGVVSFEIGQGQLARPTSLSFINAQQGFDRGGLEITDRAGHVVDIDVSDALTMQDILDKVNGQRDLMVTARVSGDRLILEDHSGGTGNLIVTGASAQSLGIDTGSAGLAQDTLTGGDLLSITLDTRLKDLNDGNGVDLLEDMIFTKGTGSTAVDLFSVDFRDTMFEAVGDPTQSTRLAALNSGNGVRLGTIRITDQNGVSKEIDLTQLGDNATMAQLRDLIVSETETAGMNIAFNFNSRDNIQVVDKSEGPEDRFGNFIIEDINGGHAAADLGINTGPEGESGANIFGETIYHMETLGDVVNAINNHYGNNGQIQVDLAANGHGLVVTDLTGDSSRLSITSRTAEDLGIQVTATTSGRVLGRRLIAGLNTVMLRSLNGGSGSADRITNQDSLTIVNRQGQTVLNGTAGLFTVQDVMDAINNADAGVTAELNATGNGLVITDTSGGIGNFTISGTLADKLGIAVDDAVGQVDSDNLQLQYVSEATRLDTLRQGRGIASGTFRITNSLGSAVSVSTTGAETVGEIISRINSAGSTLSISARINDTGDGIVIIDDSGGTNAMKIDEVNNGTTARDLNILGTADYGANYVDGSYEYKFDIGGGDTLEEIISRINEADVGVQAAIIDDGNNFRLSFTSEFSGAAGRIYLDGGDTRLSTTVLSEGQDALLLQNSLLIRSSTNSIQNVVKGSTLELKGVSSEEVTVTVGDDVDGIVAQMQSFVEAYNSVMKQIDDLTRFDPDTLEKGPLFGDATVNQAKRSLQQMVQRTFSVGGSFNRLSQIGIKFARLTTETGTNEQGDTVNFVVASTPKLEFDESAFRDAVGQDLEGVAELFTKADVGLGDVIGGQLERLAGQTTGTIHNQVQALDDRKELFQDRINRLDELLARKEERLYNQFYAMEQALASLQSQQNALTNLGSLASSFKASS